jgi:hypothetical protein
VYEVVRQDDERTEGVTEEGVLKEKERERKGVRRGVTINTKTNTTTHTHDSSDAHLTLPRAYPIKLRKVAQNGRNPPYAYIPLQIAAIACSLPHTKHSRAAVVRKQN